MATLAYNTSDLAPAPVLREKAARLLETVIFYGLLALVLLIALPYGGRDQWVESFFECAVWVFLILSITEAFFSKNLHLRHGALLWPLAAIIVFAYFQTLNIWPASSASPNVGGWGATSADPYATKIWLLKFVALVVTGFLLLRYANSERRVRTLFILVIGIAVLSALFGLLRQTAPSGWAASLLPRLKPGSGYAQFINRNQFAFLVEMAIGLTAGLLVAGGVKRDRVLLYLTAMIPLWLALVLSGSRGGLFTALCQLLFIGVWGPGIAARYDGGNHGEWGFMRRIGQSRLFRILLVACLCLTIILSAFWIGGERLVSQLESLPGELSGQEVEAVRRKDIWYSTWQMIKEHPLLGVGFGGYWMAVTQYHEGSGRLAPQQAHNDYLELAASGGVVGVALAGWFVFLFFRQVRKGLASTSRFQRAACFAALVALFGVALHSFVDFGLHLPINALVFVLLLVIALATSSQIVPSDKIIKSNAVNELSSPRLILLGKNGEEKSS